jgi:general secretion pathway protein G
MRQRQTELSNRGLMSRRFPQGRQSGVTLLEMIVVVTILLILMGAAVPVLKVSVRRQREVELRRDLWEMRAAIDRYKDAADKNAF